MIYDEVEKQAASVENLLAPHFQDESGEEMCVFSEEGWGGEWGGGHQIQIVKFTKINPTSSSHSLLKTTRICHPKICYCVIMIVWN